MNQILIAAQERSEASQVGCCGRGGEELGALRIDLWVGEEGDEAQDERRLWRLVFELVRQEERAISNAIDRLQRELSPFRGFPGLILRGRTSKASPADRPPCG